MKGANKPKNAASERKKNEGAWRRAIFARAWESRKRSPDNPTNPNLVEQKTAVKVPASGV